MVDVVSITKIRKEEKKQREVLDTLAINSKIIYFNTRRDFLGGKVVYFSKKGFLKFKFWKCVTNTN